jgi:CheY-like chemotaxis protein
MAGQRNICLMVDDDVDDREIFLLALQTLKPTAQCVFAADGEEAISQLRNTDFKPDEIFLDINMPRMNGIRCLQEIRKMEHLKHVPVFMFSTSSEPVVIEETRRKGATAYIIKPASIEELVGLLRPFI